jgi:hypothetical protein
MSRSRREHAKKWNASPEGAKWILEHRKRYRLRANKLYRIRNEERTKFGRHCVDVLRKHHELMKDDPEHLSTKFIADLVGCECPRSKKNG